MKRQRILQAIDILVLFALAVYVLLDTFLIPRSYQTVSNNSTTETASASSEAVITSNSYSDDNVSISITETVYDNTHVYIADITVNDISSLKTAFANDTYGKNITSTTSSIASSANAVLAINGDYYGAQNSGYVIRNGTLYRDTVRSSDQQDLVINTDGSFSIIEEGTTTAASLIDNGAYQVFSFGPALINEGSICVNTSSEVDQAMTSNPRTAICEISNGHYLFVVADGRTSESEGLSLFQLAQLLSEYNVSVAYNLDGGGSSTMVFNGTVINNPTTNGNKISERKVSDIVYIY